ncbi:MAG: hypothetical protein ACJAS4_001425 [Bacteriovoracaceae bacterium]|jgi:hypothetical protein
MNNDTNIEVSPSERYGSDRIGCLLVMGSVTTLVGIIIMILLAATWNSHCLFRDAANASGIYCINEYKSPLIGKEITLDMDYYYTMGLEKELCEKYPCGYKGNNSLTPSNFPKDANGFKQKVIKKGSKLTIIDSYQLTKMSLFYFFIKWGDMKMLVYRDENGIVSEGFDRKYD